MYEINARTTFPYSAICYVVCTWGDGTSTRGSGTVVGTIATKNVSVGLGGPAMIDAAKADFTRRCNLPIEHFHADSFTYSPQ